MSLLVFSQNDLPITKGLRSLTQVVTAWPAGKGSADLLYDSNETELKDILARLPNAFKPEAILLTDLGGVTFLWGIQELEIPVIATIADLTVSFDAFRHAMAFVDLFVCNAEHQVETMKALGAPAVYLPWFGFDPEVFRPNLEKPRWDVVFVGNLNPTIHQKRGKLLERLLCVPERFETRVMTGLSTHDYACALARGRIVFNHSRSGEVNRRVYEALGVSRLLLVEESNSEVLRYFESGRHVVTYSESNLPERVEYYLRHEHEREAIAQAGHQEALSKHTGFHKAQALLEILKTHLGIPKRKAERANLATLHRNAARVFLHHGRVGATLRHSEAALREADTRENRVARARVLGAVAHFHREQEPGLVDEFQRATEQAVAAVPQGAWTRFNHLELGCLLAKARAEQIRELLEEILHGRFDLEPEGGPLPIVFDRFRIAWEVAVSSHLANEELEEAARKILLARAYELLAEEERRVGRPPAAIEAYRESLRFRQDGYVEHRLGSLLFELGQLELAREALKSAVREEPFFFGARRDLAALELNGGARKEARRVASEALLLLTTPFDDFAGPFLEVLDHTSSPQELEPYALGKPILWEGVLSSPTGYAHPESILVDELLKRCLPLTLRSGDLPAQPSALGARAMERFVSAAQRPLESRFVQIAHRFPDALQRQPNTQAAICRTTCAVDRIPRSWAPALRALDQVWVESEFVRRIFLEEGISPQKLVVIPNPVGESPLCSPEGLELEDKNRFHFLSVFQWNVRKGWDLLLQAFLSEFRRSDDVALLLRVEPLEGKSHVEIRDELRAFIRSKLGLDPDRTPEVLFVDETLTHGEMRALYARADAFVLPSRGEGFGRAYLEALICGLPTIGTAWGGQIDFLTPENGYLIEIEGLEPVPEEVYHYRGAQWARPSVEHLRALLRRVYQDPEEGKRKARRSVGELLDRYNVRHVANRIVKALNGIEEQGTHGD